ncbi:hypothetical protein FRC12_007662 [Ceratobasidium sp. 428]|nr:hypothetical protein FRC12_007662 [Ceratobasidium sp. 428]
MCILAKFVIFFIVSIFGLAGVTTAAPTPHKGDVSHLVQPVRRYWGVRVFECTWQNSVQLIESNQRGTQKDSDYVAAIGKSLYDSMTPDKNPNHSKACGKMTTVKYQGKSTKVKIVDRCEACGRNDIDLSPTAFKKLGKLSEGRLKGVTWSL